MSICRNCIHYDRPGERCLHRNRRFLVDITKACEEFDSKAPKQTNFARITESPEVLAAFCDSRNICHLEQGIECQRFFKKCKQCWLGWLNHVEE